MIGTSGAVAKSSAWSLSLAKRMRYVAYGLLLDCSFPIPGMGCSADGDSQLPLLTVLRRDPADVQRAWRGEEDRPPEWHGRLGDGQDLKIERGHDNDLLFSYGERARFRLHPDLSQLDCAPRHEGFDWQRVLISKVIPSIGVMRGYEALHAAAVDSPGGIVAIMAPSGTGKSTLAAELLRRGWPLFADDQLTLGYEGSAVCAFPGTPHMNAADSIDLDPETLGNTLAVLSGEHWLAAKAVTTQTRPIRMLCLLERSQHLALKASVLVANPLLLAPYMLGLSMDEERQRTRFALYADLMESTELIRLTAGLDDRPEDLADLVEQTLVQQQHTLVDAK